MKNCSRCGALMQDNAGFCSNCGGTMLQPETVRVTVGSQNGGLGIKFKLIAGTVLAILLIAGGYLGWNSFNSQARFEKKLELAVKYLSENKYDEAILTYNDAIKIDPKNMAARVGLAQAYIGKGDFTQAEKAVKNAKEIGSLSPEQYQKLIKAYMDKEKFPEANKLLAEAQGKYSGKKVISAADKLLIQEKAGAEEVKVPVPAETAASNRNWMISVRAECDYADGDPPRFPGGDFVNCKIDNFPDMRLSADPVMENGEALVPLVQIGKALGYTVQWKQQTKEIRLQGKSLSGKDLSILMKVNNKKVVLNNHSVLISNPPRLINNNPLVPIRFIAEVMGCYVKYDLDGDEAILYVSDYPLLNDNEISNLEKDGHTSRGIKLGDSIAQVIKAYPRGVKQYPDEYTGILWYCDVIPWNCTDGGTVFKFENGILTEVYTGSY